MRKIVEFTRPGIEYIPHIKKNDENVFFTKDDRSEGIRYWNELPSHRRKFMKIKSSYINSLNDYNIKGPIHKLIQSDNIRSTNIKKNKENIIIKCK